MTTTTEQAPMHIISLQIENVKRVSAVTITPDGSLVVISGKNGAGKSTVLDSIMYAIGGAKACPKDPIRRGQNSAEVKVELDGADGKMVVIRRWWRKESGEIATDVKITNAEGYERKRPQELLDTFFDTLAFDPLAFASMPPKQQVETLKRLVAFDFDAVERERAKAYADRTECGREGARIKAEAENLPEPDGTVAVDVADLLKRRGEMDRQRRENDSVRASLRSIENDVSQRVRECNDWEIEVARLQKAMADATAQLESARANLATAAESALDMKARAAALVDPDYTALDEQLATASVVNQKVDRQKRRAELETHVADYRTEYQRLTAFIEACDEKKRDAIAAASLPVDGLSFGDDGVVYNDTAFDQCSTAERLRVSVALALATNPKLRIALIRHGNDLDADGVEIVRKMAEERDAQVIMERVVADQPASIVIEDGMVAEGASV